MSNVPLRKYIRDFCAAHSYRDVIGRPGENEATQLVVDVNGTPIYTVPQSEFDEVYAAGTLNHDALYIVLDDEDAAAFA